MTKKKFEFLFVLALMLLWAPLAWYIHFHYSLRVQLLFLTVTCAIAYTIRKLVYEPIRSKLPNDD
jgi:lipopolysaccharide export LptBFGC system permease protein LptF